VQRLLGHKAISETLDTYRYLMAGDVDRARDAVQLAFAAAPSEGRALGVR